MRHVLLVLLLAGAGCATEGPRWAADPATGCKVWSSAPEAEEVPSWSGRCRDGFADGPGKLVWAYKKDGAARQQVYEGELRAGKRHGRGAVWDTDGRRYDGEFRDELFHGRGVMRWANGDSYDGDWRDGTQNGHGIQIWANGSRYEGPWRDGLREGEGVCAGPSGRSASCRCAADKCDYK